MSKPMQDDKTHLAPYGTVAKLQWLRTIASCSDLGRTTLAACCVIADMADSKTGICWPSFSYLANACGTSTRHIKKSVNQATQKNLVTIAEHGNRVRSNRYKINLNVVGSDLQDTTQGSDLEGTRVVSCEVKGSVIQVPDVVSCRSPESIHPTEHQAREGWDRSLTEGGAQSLRAKSPTLSRQADRYDEFWEALGKRSTVYESEQLISEFIADGVDYADIVNGAKRWRAYNDLTGGRHAASPLKWLEKHKWEDEWVLPTIKEKVPDQGAKKSKGSTAKRTKNPVYIKWKQQRGVFDQDYFNKDQLLSNHLATCVICVKAIKDSSYDKTCDSSKLLVREINKAREAEKNWLTENPHPEQWLEVST